MAKKRIKRQQAQVALDFPRSNVLEIPDRRSNVLELPQVINPRTGRKLKKSRKSGR
jgi:hypothetical protein